jgi:hypothetical protein
VLRVDPGPADRVGLRMRVIVRVLVEGVLVDEVPIVIGVGARGLIGELGGAHGEIAAAADAAGLTYTVEIEFPDGQTIRWGTDPDAMVLPLPVELADLGPAAHEIIDRWHE